jgi:biotin operon repressor
VSSMWKALDLSAERRTKPELWRRKILAALKDAKTNAGAAEELGISLSTLNRYIRTLRMAGSPVPRRSRKRTT